jgi:hypothetical protein
MSGRSKRIAIVGICSFLVSIAILLVGRGYFLGQAKSGWVEVITENSINNLVEDNNGLIWFGESIHVQEDGHFYLSPWVITSVDGAVIEIPNKFAEGSIDNFLFDDQGDLWIDASIPNEPRLLVRDTQGSWKRYTPADTINSFNLMATDGDGRVWAENDFFGLGYQLF